MSEYYIYEYIRLDTNEPFYIGKGKDSRWKDPNMRSKHFTNICNKVPVAVVMLHENLTNKEALEIECWYIWQYRDIQGYNLINETDGGEGTSGYRWTDEQRQNKSKENHPRFGLHYTDEEKKGISNQWTDEMKEQHRKRNLNENNPMAKSVVVINADSNEVLFKFKTIKEMKQSLDKFPIKITAYKADVALKNNKQIENLIIRYQEE